MTLTTMVETLVVRTGQDTPRITSSMEASGWLSLRWSFRHSSREIALGPFSQRRRLYGWESRCRFSRFERRCRP